MKALMYGWEFPPLISGGLGVACYAIVKELVKKNVELTLVLPRTVGIEHIHNVTFVSSEQNSTSSYTNSMSGQEFGGKLEIKHPEITTYLHPYLNTKTSNCQFHDIDAQELSMLVEKMHLSIELKRMVLAAIKLHAASSMCVNENEVRLLTEVLRYALHAGMLAKDIPHDVIHAHDWLTTLAALEGRAYSGKPLVLHIHALETDRSMSWVDEKIFAIEKYGMQQADKIIAVSQYTKNNIVQHYGIHPNKIVVIHNGIYRDERKHPPKSIAKQNKPKMVLFVGRITHQKGPIFFIKTAKKVLEKKPDVHFVLAGTGDLLVEIIEKTAEFRIGKNVHFTGFLDSVQIHNLYQLADVYVMPSVSEPFGLSALEAVSHAVPTIIAKQSGVAEVLRHVLVTDFWDISDMAAKILALLDYSALAQTSLAHTSDDLLVTTWENAAEKIVNLYRAIISG